MSEVCNEPKKNLYIGKCTKLPLLPKMIITTPDTFKLTPSNYASTAALKTALQTAVKNGIASRIYIWPPFSSFEDTSEEAKYRDNALGQTPVRDGQYRYKFGVSQSMCIHKSMFSHRARNKGRVYLFDVDNQLFGTFDNATDKNLLGFRMALLHTEKLKLSNGDDPTESMIYICLADNEEVDKAGELIDGTAVNQVERLTDAKLEIVGTPSVTTIVVKVYIDCDTTPISGLVVADFLLKNNAGATMVIPSAAEDANNPGTYTLTDTDFVSGTLTLKAPSVLTLDAYEAINIATVTVV